MFLLRLAEIRVKQAAGSPKGLPPVRCIHSGAVTGEPNLNRAGRLARGLRFALTHSVPTTLRHIGGTTQSEPGTPDVLPLGERLFRSEIAEFDKHQIVNESATEGRSELLGDRGPELAEAHSSSVDGTRHGRRATYSTN